MANPKQLDHLDVPGLTEAHWKELHQKVLASELTNTIYKELFKAFVKPEDVEKNSDVKKATEFLQNQDAINNLYKSTMTLVVETDNNRKERKSIETQLVKCNDEFKQITQQYNEILAQMNMHTKPLSPESMKAMLVLTSNSYAIDIKLAEGLKLHSELKKQIVDNEKNYLNLRKRFTEIMAEKTRLEAIDKSSNGSYSQH